MLSIGLVRSAGDAARYYEKDDYYAPDPAAPGGAEGREGGDVAHGRAPGSQHAQGHRGEDGLGDLHPEQVDAWLRAAGTAAAR